MNTRHATIGGCTFKGHQCSVVVSRYQAPPHPRAMWLQSESGEPMATASVFIDHMHGEGQPPLADDEIVVKNWSENEGMHEALQAAGIIGPVLRIVIPALEPRIQVPATVHKILVPLP